MSTNSITRQSRVENTSPSAGIQSRINCQHVATALFGEGTPAGSSINYYAPQLDPDNPVIYVMPDYFRNPVTGYRGGAIKLVQRCKSYSYQNAVAYLEGFEAGKATK